MMKIPKIKSTIRMSTWAKITRFFIAVNIFPIYRKNCEEIRFSWLSFRTFLFLVLSYMPFVVIVVSVWTQYDFWSEYIEKSTSIYLKFEIMIIWISLVITFVLSPIQVLFLCHPFIKLQDISMSTSLKSFSNIQLLELLPANLISGGFIAFCYAHYMEVCKLVENTNHGTCFANILVVPLFLTFYGMVFLAIPYFIALIWLQNIEEQFKCKCKNVTNKLQWAEKCIKLYQQLEHSLGSYFLVYFTQSQFIWIILFFFAISLAISDNGFSRMSVLMHSLGIIPKIFLPNFQAYNLFQVLLHMLLPI